MRAAGGDTYPLRPGLLPAPSDATPRYPANPAFTWNPVTVSAHWSGNSATGSERVASKPGTRGDGRLETRYLFGDGLFMRMRS